MANGGSGDVARAKHALRPRLLERRARRTAEECAAAAEALSDRVLAMSELVAATTVCCYVSTVGEPGTGPLLERLHSRGTRVLLPVLLPDFDLDWAAYEPGALVPGRFGLSEPSGRALGRFAVADAVVVICPGLAVDGAGRRLGRGGGSYDRALGRLGGTSLRMLLLYDDEVLGAVPAGAHDEPVDVTVTPAQVVWHRRAPGASASTIGSGTPDSSG